MEKAQEVKKAQEIEEMLFGNLLDQGFEPVARIGYPQGEAIGLFTSGHPLKVMGSQEKVAETIIAALQRKDLEMKRPERKFAWQEGAVAPAASKDHLAFYPVGITVFAGEKHLGHLKTYF